MQNLSLLQLLKLLSACASFPSDEKEDADTPACAPSCKSPSDLPMPEREVKKEGKSGGGESLAAQKNAPTSSARAYETFSSRHEQALKRAQKRKE